MIIGIDAMNIESLDLNLLLVVESLLIERNVTKAGHRIGLSQPAVSNALARLRGVFDDPLFLRRGNAMVPTRRTLQLSGPVMEALGKIRGAIGDETFTPARAQLTFSIAASEYAEIVLLPSVVRCLNREAPGVRLSISRLRALLDVPLETLRDGATQFALGLFPQPISSGTGIAFQLLLDDVWVCLARVNHPRIKNTLPLRTFASIEHIRVSYGEPERPGLIGEAMRSIGMSRKIGFSTPHMAIVPTLAAETDLLGIVPARLARKYASRTRLKTYPVPLRLPRTTLALLWQERNQHDPAHGWLRQVILRAALQLSQHSS
jgi:DNA-binding transcriptional LysR family regulator